ncbi:hypothetical protein E0L36_21920 [Streptomyces sp. AJS327]|uniref:hypothetical protein n=1 Tax=Streptomyces sp. AJS327 TaxID=2545265 RepID=UPI0015DE9254|nr:hypothetical protein [Streptomyces sp. AJS327]MBA0053434.1 hypothetical protein [Streptomyces sp. AJS327]
MACGCQSKGKKFQVVTAAGKIVFETGSKPTADAVSKRYPNSKVEEKKPATTGRTANTSAATVSTRKTPGGA